MIKPSIASNFLMNRFNQAVILLITALFIAVIIFIPRFFENHNDAPTSTKTPDKILLEGLMTYFLNIL